MQTTWTMLLVMDIMKLESPRAAISRMVFRHGRMQDTRMRRIAFGLVRKCTVHMAEASWDMTVAMAAPRIHIPMVKMKRGSRMIFSTAPMRVVTIPILAKPWALI